MIEWSNPIIQCCYSFVQSKECLFGLDIFTLQPLLRKAVAEDEMFHLNMPLGVGSWIIDRSRFLFLLCPQCTNELNWQHTDASYELCASCCRIAYKAIPADDRMRYYSIVGKEVSDKNVIPFRRYKRQK